MRKFISVFMVVFALAVVAGESALAGGSNGKGGQTLTASCNILGNVTVHASNGQSAWVNNTHYVTLWFTGTFTPVGGMPSTSTKSYGRKAGFTGQRYTCSGSQMDSTGTFSFTAIVGRTPTH
jgi:hypothetical protein